MTSIVDIQKRVETQLKDVGDNLQKKKRVVHAERLFELPVYNRFNSCGLSSRNP